jgi:hypothetical protein
MTEATQRPWAVMQNAYGMPGIVDADGEYIVEEVANNADMNADLIVKAVNAHDALVAALERLVDIVDVRASEFSIHSIKFQVSVTKAREALEAAK